MTTTGTTGTSANTPIGTESSLSNWVGPYATNLLGKAEALGSQPYQTYKGPLTAWYSPLQEQGFQQAAGLSTPSSISDAASTLGGIADTLQNQDPYMAYHFQTQFFGTPQAQQYMNPYLETALNPSLAEARRQADISRLTDASRLTQAGAYGGSRQAIMESEGRRNLMDKQNEMLSKGYMDAYDKAQLAFKSDMDRAMDVQKATESSRQFAAKHGLEGLQAAANAAKGQGDLGVSENAANLNNLNALMDAGKTQRSVEAEGIKADYDEFVRQRDYPMEMLKFQQSMLQGMPLESRSYAYEQPSTLQEMFGTMSGLLGLYNQMFGNTSGTSNTSR